MKSKPLAGLTSTSNLGRPALPFNEPLDTDNLPQLRTNGMKIHKGITTATQKLLDGMETDFDFKESANVDAEDR